MSRNKFNAGYIGVDKTSFKKNSFTTRGSLTSEEGYNLKLRDTYRLDGVNILSVVPDAHFDAAKINGIDSSGNPSDGATMVDWVSLIGPHIAKAHGTTAYMPVWEDGVGRTDHPDIPYVDFFTDYMHMEPTFSAGDNMPFTIWSVGRKDTAGYYQNFSSSSNMGYVYFSHSNNYDYIYHSHANSTPPAGFPLTTEAQIWMFERDSSMDTRMYHHGNNVGAAKGTKANYLAFPRMGYSHETSNGFAVKGNIYEVMVWMNAKGSETAFLSNADKNALIAYANAKYSFSTSTTDF